MTPSDAALLRRDVGAVGAGFVLAIILTTAWGIACPITWIHLPEASMVVVEDVDPLASAIVGVAAFIGGMLAGWWGWALLVERRRPWPFAPRGPRLDARWQVTVPPLAAAIVSVNMLRRLVPDEAFVVGTGRSAWVQWGGTSLYGAIGTVVAVPLALAVSAAVLAFVVDWHLHRYPGEPIWRPRTSPPRPSGDLLTGP